MYCSLIMILRFKFNILPGSLLESDVVRINGAEKKFSRFRFELKLIVYKLAGIIALSVDSEYQNAKEQSINQNETKPCRTLRKPFSHGSFQADKTGPDHQSY